MAKPPVSGACPICGAPVDRADPAVQPFCSERCKLIDLGAWASGRYAIPGERIDSKDRDAETPEGGEPPETDEPATPRRGNGGPGR